MKILESTFGIMDTNTILDFIKKYHPRKVSSKHKNKHGKKRK